MTKTSRELQLDKRDKFFSDPVFQHDILSFSGDENLQNKLDVLRHKCAQNTNALVSTAPSALQRSEAAHNLQVTCSNDKFMVQLELPGFSPEDFKLKTRDDVIILEASHEAKAPDGQEFTARRYCKEFQMPDGVQPEYLSSSYNSLGILTIEAPRVMHVPEGADVQEAMAAKSKAYTTDDGKTAVNEKSQASSQVIAATTESPDGKHKSSITYSSSSSSSSSVVTSGDMGPNMALGGGFPAISSGFGNFPEMPAMQHFPQMPNFPPIPMDRGGFPQMSSNFPDMSSNFPQMSLDLDMEMDSMMKKMMSGMSINNDNLKKSMNVSRNTNSTFSEMQNRQQRHNVMDNSKFTSQMDMMKPKFGIPSPGYSNRMGNDLDIEELSNAGSDISSNYAGPSYTVTSPPPSTIHRIKDPVKSPTPSSGFPQSTSHSVKPSSDYFEMSSVNDPQSDCTVLLKLKEGDEYKLVLNMQQYSPENITVKLNDDRELTVVAHASADGNEDFLQRHLIPKGIDLENLTSSFSSDGILVIKAPKLKK